MNDNEFFPARPDVEPMIYAYEEKNPRFAGCLKVGYAAAEKERRVRRALRFLWNAKMRFGKTFAAYQLAKRIGARRVLVLTFKPAVRTAWREDLVTHVDFEGWQFISRPQGAEGPSADEQYRRADKRRPIVCFGSFQDFLGYSRETGGIKPAIIPRLKSHGVFW